MTHTITEADKIHEQWYVDARTQTVETLPAFLRHLCEDYGHDYGTICHAVAAAALGAAHAVNHSPAGGITGFQAGAVMWEFISHWQSLEGHPLRLVDYFELLYPQYASKFEKTITPETHAALKVEATKRLAGFSDGLGHPDVKAHMDKVAGGWLPFGFTVHAS
jgi:hypothetical protein